MIAVDTLLPSLKPADPSKYLEETIYLSDEVSPNKPGYLDLSGQPWARQILNSVLDPSIH